MIAVIFEVELKPEEKETYLGIAADLKVLLVEMEGFISIERFQSLVDPDKLLSLSFWEDEAAVINWRNEMSHREAQAEGRASIFKDYRIRVAGVMRDYGMTDRSEAPYS